MAVELLMPKMGMTMEEGTVLKWHKKVGDQIKKGEVLLEIQTDKVKMEIEAPVDGILLAVMVNEGDVVPVNTSIAYIGEAGEKVLVREGAVVAPARAETASPTEHAALYRPTGGLGEKVKATPASRRLAREKGIDLKQVRPSGPGGRVLAEDVANVKVTPLAQKIAQDQGIDLAALTGTGAGGKVTRKDLEQKDAAGADWQKQLTITPLHGLRKVIAKRMSTSWANAPHASISLEVDMSEVARLREKLMPVIEKKAGIKLSYNHLIIRVVSQALAENQALNARFVGSGIEYSVEVNVGVAMATPEGLIVPVLHNANRLSIEQIALQTNVLIGKARTGKLVLQELEGGTFTISNLGMFGITIFTPILNPPEVGILGAGRIVERPAVENGLFVARPVMTLSLSFDHRAVDGAQAAMFLVRIKELLEEPLMLL